MYGRSTPSPDLHPSVRTDVGLTRSKAAMTIRGLHRLCDWRGPCESVVKRLHFRNAFANPFKIYLFVCLFLILRQGLV